MVARPPRPLQYYTTCHLQTNKLHTTKLHHYTTGHLMATTLLYCRQNTGHYTTILQATYTVGSYRPQHYNTTGHLQATTTIHYLPPTYQYTT